MPDLAPPGVGWGERADPLPCMPAGGVVCHPADLTFSAAADVSLDRLDGELVRHGQWFPADVPGVAQLGPMVEWDATGPLRLGYGGLRDNLLGVQFEDGLGRLVTVGGRVMKNVAGYDLTKFMLGQRGVFGRVVTVTARSYRRPEAAVAARFSGRVDVARLRPAPSWTIEVRGGVWAGWLGTESAVGWASDALNGHGGVQVIRHDLASDAALRQRLWTVPGTDDDGEAMRISLPPTSGGVRAFVVAHRLLHWTSDPWHGLIKARVPAERRAEVRDAAWEAGGRAESDEGFSPVRVTAAEAAVLRRLKAAWDPEGRLGPLELEVLS